jgi:hypothetical protein
MRMCIIDAKFSADSKVIEKVGKIKLSKSTMT